MGITVNNPTDLNLYERHSNNNLILEFVNRHTRDFIRFEADLEGVEIMAEKLNKWIDEKKQSNRPKEDKDNCKTIH